MAYKWGLLPLFLGLFFSQVRGAYRKLALKVHPDKQKLGFLHGKSFFLRQPRGWFLGGKLSKKLVFQVPSVFFLLDTGLLWLDFWRLDLREKLI